MFHNSTYIHGFLPLFHLRILLKICNCLKSRSKETRDVARETVIKMTQSLGPSYVPYVVKEMKDALTKGYQVWIRMCACMCACVRVCRRVCVCACMCACMHVFQVSVATALVC